MGAPWGLPIKTAMTKVFRELKHAGVQGVVWFLLADGGAAPSFNSSGEIVSLDATFVADFKAGLAIAEENEMSVVWVLLDHLWLKPAETSGSAQLFGHARLMDDPLQTVFLQAGGGSVCRAARQRASDFRPQGRRSALPRADQHCSGGDWNRNRCADVRWA